MTSTPESVDADLLSAHDLALAALREVTPAQTIGDPVGYTVEEGGAVSLRFANTLPGYPGWFWTVSVARVEGEAPTVLEVELLPGDGALLAPDWVPWAERLADYQAAQTALAEASDSDEDDFDDDEEDEDDEDDDEDEDGDDEGVSRTHAGDIDGVEIDELDDAHDDEESDEGDDDDSDDDESDDDEEYFDRSEPASDER